MFYRTNFRRFKMLALRTMAGDELKRVIVTFVCRVECYSAMQLVRYCTDCITNILRISSKINVLSHSIAYIVQQSLDSIYVRMFRRSDTIFDKCIHSIKR